MPDDWYAEATQFAHVDALGIAYVVESEADSYLRGCCCIEGPDPIELLCLWPGAEGASRRCHWSARQRSGHVVNLGDDCSSYGTPGLDGWPRDPTPGQPETGYLGDPPDLDDQDCPTYVGTVLFGFGAAGQHGPESIIPRFWASSYAVSEDFWTLQLPLDKEWFAYLYNGAAAWTFRIIPWGHAFAARWAAWHWKDGHDRVHADRISCEIITNDAITLNLWINRGDLQTGQYVNEANVGSYYGTSKRPGYWPVFIGGARNPQGFYDAWYDGHCESAASGDSNPLIEVSGGSIPLAALQPPNVPVLSVQILSDVASQVAACPSPMFADPSTIDEPYNIFFTQRGVEASIEIVDACLPLKACEDCAAQIISLDHSVPECEVGELAAFTYYYGGGGGECQYNYDETVDGVERYMTLVLTPMGTTPETYRLDLEAARIEAGTMKARIRWLSDGATRPYLTEEQRDALCLGFEVTERDDPLPDLWQDIWLELDGPLVFVDGSASCDPDVTSSGTITLRRRFIREVV